MSDFRGRCALVLGISLAILLGDMILAIPAVAHGASAAAFVGGAALAAIPAAMSLVLLWASNGEQGVGTW